MTMGAFPTDPIFERDESEAAFIRGLRNRLGFDPTRTIFGRSLARQQAPFETTFGFERMLAPSRPGFAAPATPPENPFLNFVQGNTLPAVNQQSLNLFRELNATGPGRGVREQFAQPEVEQAGDLRNLAVSALMSQISPLALRMLRIPSGSDLRSQFLAEQPADQDFINFLRSRIGFGVL